MIKEEHHSNLY